MDNFKTTKVEVEIDYIRPNKWNPNVQDKKMFEKEKKSILELGFLGSILCREHEVTGYYEILDGEHRWKAAKELGYTKMMVENIGKIPDEEAKLLTILINNLKGKDDVFKRAKILEALNEGQLSLLPFTAEEIEHEKQFVKFNFADFDNGDEPDEEKQFGKVIVLPMTTEEGLVWEFAKQQMMKRDMIKSKNKKRQDIEMVMKLIRGFLSLAVPMDDDERTQLTMMVDTAGNIIE